MYEQLICCVLIFDRYSLSFNEKIKFDLIFINLLSIGYHQVEDKAYPEIMYDFAKIIDLDRFWHDLYEISTATLLGHSDGMSGKEVVIEDITKKAAMIQTLKGRYSILN